MPLKASFFSRGINNVTALDDICLKQGARKNEDDDLVGTWNL